MPSQTKEASTKTTKKKVERLVAGWREWLSIPALDIHAIKAKLDTGARTSALHAWRIEPFERDGETWVSFDVHPAQRSGHISIPCEARVVSQKTVRSSSGQTEDRFVIKTDIRLGERSKSVEITLTNRDEMGFRMLLGRSAMKRWLIVDPSKSFIQGKKPDIVVAEQKSKGTDP